MLNKIWPFFIITSFIYSIYSGKILNLNSAIFDSGLHTVNLCFGLLGSICLWNGIMKIALETPLIEKLIKFLKPFISFIFPEIKDDKKISKEISINIASNILGLGNASTPLGLKAMNSMQEKNPAKDTLSNAMAMFLLINTASIQIIPTTIISIRSSLGSKDPTKILLAVWFSTTISFLTAIISGKLLSKKM